MKYLSRTIIAIILAVLTATLLPVQVFADTPDYISEIKVYQGSFDKAAEEGFTILNGDDGKPVDLNQGSGSTDTGAKGNKKVFLGYKTTKKRSEAITDLALMNMKGGYDVKEYELLMESQMKEQIIPFVEDFQAAIDEYRTNYNSSNTTNKQRAQYSHDMLNKLTDDDCGGAGLGDLLLNKTKYELGDEAYNKLSDEEKKNHADILTIIAQANGQATLLFENLITRAADTNSDTWLERFAGTTYDNLMELYSGSPSDIAKKLAKAYDDDAQTILKLVSKFRAELESYDDAVEIVNKTDYEALGNIVNNFYNLDEKATKEEFEKAYDEYVKAQNEMTAYHNAVETVAVYNYLEDTDYEDGTLLDFFLMSDEDFEDDITVLYPLVASFTKGQRAGLEFVSLKEMIVMSLTDSSAYQEYQIKNMEPVSIYEGVDRAIYEKGGVALTSDALRSDAMSKVMEESEKSMGGLTIALIAITCFSAASFIASASIAAYMFKVSKYWAREVAFVKDCTKGTKIAGWKLADFFNDPELNQGLSRGDYETLSTKAMNISSANGKICAGLATGFCVAMIVLSAVTIYINYKDMKAYYNVDFTPIPHYMVDKKDLIGYNAKGEEIVLKNQAAYYKAAQSNRKEGDSYYKNIDTCADMNGCVNPQWLALYVARNNEESPILANSFKVVVGSTTIPEGYKTGIHFFGEKAAFNLNDKRYCWNQKAKSVMVYYKTDSIAAGTTGSNFTTGSIALAGGGGILLGAAAAALGMNFKKRKDNATQTV